MTLYPSFEKLKRDIDVLRANISAIVFERDELLYHRCKNLEMAYMLSVGVLEYKVYELDCAILRLRRKIELLQAKKNRQEKINIVKIEEKLDAEFEEYQAKLDEEIHKMNAAIERGRNCVLEKEEILELKKLYRVIVKTLHPDLHTNLSCEKIKLFYNAVAAYENGDLDQLRIISAMTSPQVFQDELSGGIEPLQREKPAGKIAGKGTRRHTDHQIAFPLYSTGYCRKS